MSAEEKLLDFFKKQIEVEKEIVNSLETSLEKIGNPAVRGVLKGISLDSLKHSEMYEAASRLLMGKTPPLTQENLDEQRELVEKHIRIELELIKKIEDILPEVKDEKINFYSTPYCRMREDIMNSLKDY